MEPEGPGSLASLAASRRGAPAILEGKSQLDRIKKFLLPMAL